MRKRTLSLALALAISLLLLPTAALADDGDFVIENGVLTKYNGKGGTVTIPQGVTSIGSYAFESNDIIELFGVTIPDSVTSIEANAFFGKGSMRNVTIGNSVTNIGELAFYSCNSLTDITIPASVTNIEQRALGCCMALTQIKVDLNNQNYMDVNGVLCTKAMDTLVAYPAGKSQLTYTIPEGVTSIGRYAFDGCRGLVSVTIPNSVTKIEGWAFSDCHGLTEIMIPDSVTSIGEWAFQSNKLTRMSISDGVTDIGKGAFFYCANLTDVYYSGTEAQWKAIEISAHNDPLTSATIHYNSVMPKGPISTAYAATQAVLVDGKTVEFQMYALRDGNNNPTNYVKLRDVASVLNGTAAQFEVGWDRDGVTITTGKPYTPNGSEMSTPFSGDPAYDFPEAQTRVNGKGAALEAIVLTDDRGGQYTYYKLRDLGTALGFRVDWSKEKGVFIETK